MTEISIIIPVYNSEKLISRCLDSIIHQNNLPSIEILIINDGSTDHTVDVVNDYAMKHDFIKVINQENQKQSAARNNGLQHASGTYIMFFDSDDYLETEMISLMYGKIQQTHTDLCVCGIKKIFNNRTEIETKSCFEISKNYIANYLSHHQEMDVGLWNKLFRREIIIQNKIQFENGNFFEDTLFVFKYICNIQNGISFIDKPLYNLIKRENSTTTDYNPDIEKYALRLTAKIREYLEVKNLIQFESYLNVLELRSIMHVIHHNMKFNQINKKEKIKKLLSMVQFRNIILLPPKYKIALIFMKTTPSLYEKIYLRNKSV